MGIGAAYRVDFFCIVAVDSELNLEIVRTMDVERLSVAVIGVAARNAGFTRVAPPTLVTDAGWLVRGIG